MSIEELKQECSMYIENLSKADPRFFVNFQHVQKFCNTINNSVTDECYNRMQNAYNCFCSIDRGEFYGKITCEEIIKITKDFFNKVSPNLKDRFIAELNKGLISIDKNNPDKCLYLSKTVDGKEKHYCKVYIKHTGTIYDVLKLVHEFFHTLTDVIDYKRKIILDKNTLDYIQETVSILAEFTCAKYLEDTYPTEMRNNLLYRVYAAVYISFQSGKITLHYLNSVMGGMSIEELQKKFFISEIRDNIKKQRVPFSINHFAGTMISITKLQDIKEPLELLSDVFSIIENEELEYIGKIIPMTLNASKVIESISNEKSFQKTNKRNSE